MRYLTRRKNLWNINKFSVIIKFVTIKMSTSEASVHFYLISSKLIYRIWNIQKIIAKYKSIESILKKCWNFGAGGNDGFNRNSGII